MDKLDEIRSEIANDICNSIFDTLSDAFDLTMADLEEEGCTFTELAIAKSVIGRSVNNFFELLTDNDDFEECPVGHA